MMKADAFLEEHGIDFETVEQDNPSKTCDDAARERGLETSQIVKSLIVERGGDYFHVLVSGDRTLSGKKFGEHRMVEPEKSRELTGFESGVVHPFSTELEHFVDNRLFDHDELSFTTGDELLGVIIGAEDLKEALESAGFEIETGDFVSPTEEDYRRVEEHGIDEDNAKFIVDSGNMQVFSELASRHPAASVLKAIEELEREDVEPEEELVEELVERAENDTHMQRMVQHYAENNEFPQEEDGFDLGETVEEVVDENPEAVEDYRDGQESAINYLLGQVMRRTGGRAEGGEARETLLEAIG